MTISTFARETGLSPKALRLYAESGLLLPAHVDASSGYRYYDEDQRPRARRIALMRQAGMPLARIGIVLDEAGTETTGVTRLMQWWREEEAVEAERRGIVDYLRSTLLAEEAPEHRVSSRTVPDRMLASSLVHVTQQDLVPTLVRLRDRLRAHLDADGATRGVEWQVVYHGAVTPDDDGPIEVGVPYEGSTSPAPDIALRVDRSHREAFTPLPAQQCRYPDILHAFDAVEQWVHRHGHRIGPPREIYPVEWDEHPDAGPVVEVAQTFEPDAGP